MCIHAVIYVRMCVQTDPVAAAVCVTALPSSCSAVITHAAGFVLHTARKLVVLILFWEQAVAPRAAAAATSSLFKVIRLVIWGVEGEGKRAVKKKVKHVVHGQIVIFASGNPGPPKLSTPTTIASFSSSTTKQQTRLTNRLAKRISATKFPARSAPS